VVEDGWEFVCVNRNGARNGKFEGIRFNGNQTVQVGIVR